MSDNACASPPCEHYWSWVSPAGTSHAARICNLCHLPDAAWLEEVIGDCVCDHNPATTDGPQEDCPEHGRPYSYWAEATVAKQQQIDELRTELDATKAGLAVAASLACGYCCGSAVSCSRAPVKCCPDCTGSTHQWAARALRVETEVARLRDEAVQRQKLVREWQKLNEDTLAELAETRADRGIWRSVAADESKRVEELQADLDVANGMIATVAARAEAAEASLAALRSWSEGAKVDIEGLQAELAAVREERELWRNAQIRIEAELVAEKARKVSEWHDCSKIQTALIEARAELAGARAEHDLKVEAGREVVAALQAELAAAREEVKRVCEQSLAVLLEEQLEKSKLVVENEELRLTLARQRPVIDASIAWEARIESHPSNWADEYDLALLHALADLRAYRDGGGTDDAR